MKVYLKVHSIDENETIACCDEELLNQVFKDGCLKIDISNQFFGGELISLDVAIGVLKQAYSFNIVGKRIIEKAIDCKILSKDSVKLISGVPMAIKMMF